MGGGRGVRSGKSVMVGHLESCLGWDSWVRIVWGEMILKGSIVRVGIIQRVLWGQIDIQLLNSLCFTS